MFDNLSIDKSTILDIRDVKSKDLVKTLYDLVKDTQSVIVRTLPDKLIMTQQQYNLLANKSEMITQGPQDQEFHLYRTPMNIMEVEIK